MTRLLVLIRLFFNSSSTCQARGLQLFFCSVRPWSSIVLLLACLLAGSLRSRSSMDNSIVKIPPFFDIVPLHCSLFTVHGFPVHCSLITVHGFPVHCSLFTVHGFPLHCSLFTVHGFPVHCSRFPLHANSSPRSARHH